VKEKFEKFDAISFTLSRAYTVDMCCKEYKIRHEEPLYYYNLKHQ